MNYKNAINNIYQNRNDSIIIGLTGRTGAGCSTVAEILKTQEFSELSLQNSKTIECEEEQIKNRIIYDYLSVEKRWQPFISIEVSSVILSFALEQGIDRMVKYIKNITSEKGQEPHIVLGDIHKVECILNTHRQFFELIKKYNLNKVDEIDTPTIHKYFDFYFKEVKNFKIALKKELNNINCNKIIRNLQKGIISSQLDFYTYILQQMGNNLRASGDCFSEEKLDSYSYVIEKRIDKLIQLIKRYNNSLSKDKPLRVCIDALRNPMEILYFKDNYSSFYMFSINTDESERKRRLNTESQEELENIDIVEYPQKYQFDNQLFYHQDIQKCIEFSNVHIRNNRSDNGKYVELTEQVLRYIALIMHPGLVAPTKEEYCMQLAYNAKLNSGCLSRQVGAVITSSDYSVRAVGWNDVPSKQVPCALRDVPSYCKFKHKGHYSNFEIHNKEFDHALQVINDKIKNVDLQGLPYCYCFKDIYNTLENNKNQVHTRALHAEENAFLQITKYGGQGINGGRLFVTASPCELCSKKSYQLGIKDIYYIDPYPGIAQDNILCFGTGEHNPKVHLFKGVVGDTYVSLYSKRLAFKDELEYITGIKNRDVIKEMFKPKIEEIKFSDIIFENITVNFEFKSRTEIVCSTTYSFRPKVNDLERLEFITSWTGSSFGESTCEQYELLSYPTGNETSHKYSVEFKNKLEKDKLYEYTIVTKVSDATLVMMPYVSQKIKHLVKALTINLIYNVTDTFINEKKIYNKCYADFEMKQELKGRKSQVTLKEDKKVSTFKVNNPNLNYCYAIVWEFTKNA